MGGCTVPSGYEPLQTGGAQKEALACKNSDGTFDIKSYVDGTPILTGIDQACLNKFGSVTMAMPGDSRCGAAPSNPQTGPATGPCALPKDKKYIKCPPSNGVTADYYLDAETGAYAVNMTTQSPDCANQPNVIQVGPNSPYCGGSNVEGPGSGPPSLVLCFVSPGQSQDQTVVDVHNGPDYALLASGVFLKDVPTRFPGRRWIMVTQQYCSALPDFGISTPASAPAPTPPTLPTTPIQPAAGALPPPQNMTYPTQPTGSWSGSPFGAPPSNLIPPPASYPTQQPARAPAAAPPPAPPAPPPAPIPCPPRPLKVAEWTLRCVTGV